MNALALILALTAGNPADSSCRIVTLSPADSATYVALENVAEEVAATDEGLGDLLFDLAEDWSIRHARGYMPCREWLAKHPTKNN